MDSCAEFEVEVTVVPPHTAAYALRTGPYASILVASQGEGSELALGDESLHLRDGSVVFVSADAEVVISTAEQQLSFYRAHVNLGGVIGDSAN